MHGCTLFVPSTDLYTRCVLFVYPFVQSIIMMQSALNSKLIFACAKCQYHDLQQPAGRSKADTSAIYNTAFKLYCTINCSMWMYTDYMSVSVPSKHPDVSDMSEETIQTEEEVNWLDCVSAIETDRGVVYFCNVDYFLQDEGSISTSEQDKCFNFEQAQLKLERLISGEFNYGNQSACDSVDGDRGIADDSEDNKPLLTPVADFVSRFHHGHGCFMYSITAYNPLDTQQDTVQNCLCNQLLLADLHETFPDCKVFSNFSYFPRRPHHFERGFTVALPLVYPHDHQGIIHSLAIKYRQAAYFKCHIASDGLSTQTIVLLEEYVKEVQESLVVIERLGYHPAYLTRKNNSVFHGFHDAMNILFKCEYLPEASQLMEIAKQQLALLPSLPVKTKMNHPVVVMEGTSDAGISHQSLRLSQAIGGTHLQSPPSCIKHMRETFDKQNKLVQAAFYTVGNYILVSHIEEASKHAPVVLDRFWNSTAAFTITSEIGRGVSNLPPKDHFVYDWPIDLFKPDAVILVGSKKSIRHATRVERKSGSGERITKQLMFETLCRMKTSSWIEVDRIRDQCHSDEAVTMVTIDKLHAKKIGGFHALGTKKDGWMCPGTSLHPSKEHDTLPVGGLTSSKEDSVHEEIGFM